MPRHDGNPKPLPSLRPRDIDRFWTKVDKAPGQGPTGECWGWRGSFFNGGYGAFHIFVDGALRTLKVSRVAYFLNNGSDPFPLIVRHTCDWPPCVRHLITGTQAENCRDAAHKHRKPKREKIVAATAFIPGRVVEFSARMLKLFWSHVDVRGGKECWMWMAHKLPSGYGQFNSRLHHQKWLAHRLSWTLANGPIPVGLLVLHSCDNPSCCNPAHLSVGTQLQNLADCVRKGRMHSGDAHFLRQHPEQVRRGSQCPNTKISDSQIPLVHKMVSEGRSRAQVALTFGVGKAQISRIVSGTRRAHLHPSKLAE